MIGNLRARVGIYAPNKTPDEIGGSVQTYSLQRVVWANIRPMNSGERTEQGRLSVWQVYKVTIRFMDDFPERARLMWKGRRLRVVTSSDPDNRRERLHLMCEEEQQ